jgi:phospholipid/cholesterol/gamma-HCH transport system substrate-binding protein
MTKPKPSRARLVAVTAVVAALFAATFTGFASAKDPATIVVYATFDNASPLLPGSDVKLKGVRVGRVASMVVGPDGKANVALELEPAALPLHTDATAAVRPVSLLGERYLELTQGSSAAPALPKGGTIPASQTSQNTDLDQVLRTLDEPTGEAIAALVTVLGTGMQGNGANINDAITALAPAMRDTEALAAVLNEQNDLLNSLVDNVTPVATALAVDGGATMDALVGATRQLLDTTAARQAAFEQALAELPATLSTARAALADLTGAADQTVPSLRSLRPITGNLAEISGELERFADALDPALAAADPVLAKAQSLLDEARPVVSALRASGSDTVAVAESARPIVGELTDNITNVLNFIKFWALSTNGSDALSHYFRAMIVVTPDTVTGALPGIGSNLGIGGSPAPLVLDPAGRPVDPLTPQQPGGGPAGYNPLAELLLPGLLAPRPTPDGGVTGLSTTQESGILGFLLGGL